MKYIDLSQGQVALVDDSDFEQVSEHRWFARLDKSGTWYAFTNVRSDTTHSGYTTIDLHRFVSDAMPGELIDHIDGDGLNCQQDNLRRSNKQRNGANRKLNANSRSGFKGVTVYNDGKHYQARIRVDGRVRWLGSFKTAIEAARAYDQAAIAAFGQHAKTNAHLGLVAA